MDYASLAATSLRMLKEHGQKVQLKNATPEDDDYDLDTGTVVPADPVLTDRYGAEFPLEGEQTFQGTLVERTDTKMLLDAEGAAPSTEDKVVFADGSEKSILSAQALAPAGVPVLYTLHLRA
jgi:hypothetical protein